MGDFTGFTFGNWHSTDLETGLVTVLRVSGGDRYDEELFPEMKDRTVEIAGVNGEYYFGSDYGTRKIEIEIAYDSLTEVQFRKLRQIFGTKDIKSLIFDERPYKKYMAKIESPIELSYVCFDEPIKTIGEEQDGIRYIRTTRTVPGAEVDTAIVGTSTVDSTSGTTEVVEKEKITPFVIDRSKTQRIYKGEGKITFICYFPFAKSVYKVLPYSYQLTTDTEIQENKKYFKLEDMLYVFVDNPDVSEINTYYEMVTDKECEEWAISSGILSVDDYADFDTYNATSHTINIYNAGDVPTGFYLYIPATAAGSEVTLHYRYGTDTIASLKIALPSALKTGDVGVLIDTNNELIIGVTNSETYTTSSNLYNKYVMSGYFFKLEPCTVNDSVTLYIDNGVEGIEIFYDYLYF